jgi:hypothetical protein
MKKILIILTALLIFNSCEDYEKMNINKKDPANVSGESLFTNAQKNLFDQMVSSNVNLNIFRMFAQQWTETTYTDEANYDLDTRTIPDGHWDALYRDVLKDLDEAKKVITETTYTTTEDPAVKTNKIAIADILMVYTFSVLVETFGDIPYSEALSMEHLLPAYDDAATIYSNLISRLTTDIGQLDDANDSFGTADNMYEGDVAGWIKFGNSLKLRMGLLIADVNSTLAKTTVEAAVAPAAGGIFISNKDNAAITYLGADPNTNPIYSDLVASGRHDFVPANTLVDSMNSLDDPRRQYYFTQIDTSTQAGVVKLAYVGGAYGASNNYLSYSHVADKIQEATFEGTILDYAEVEFLLAEAAERGFNVGGTAESHYNAAIRASIEYWEGTNLEVTNYLANPKVAYTTAEGTWKQKIGMQSWIALYNRGFEAWTAWRKFDYPLLEAPVDAVSDIPVRYTYPIDEQTLNGDNYTSASAAIGGDDVTTKLFFDLF